MYIAGTNPLNARDIADDVMLPFSGSAATRRYKIVRRALDAHPEVTRLVGHSLGAAVAERLAQERGLDHELYSAPRISWQNDSHSHRHWLDPVSVLDRGAQGTWSPNLNPHTVF